MEAVVIFALGLLVGVAIAMLLLKYFQSGTLNVDLSDVEDGPYLFLELTKDISAVMKKKHVILKVRLKRYVPQK